MKLTGNVVFEKTFDTYFFIVAKFYYEGVKMGVKVWGEILIKFHENLGFLQLKKEI